MASCRLASLVCITRMSCSVPCHPRASYRARTAMACESSTRPVIAGARNVSRLDVTPTSYRQSIYLKLYTGETAGRLSNFDRKPIKLSLHSIAHGHG